MKKRLLWSIGMALMLISTEVWAQTHTVRGRVTSGEDGSNLPGVNVILRGTSQGTVTDFNGEYTITIPSPNETLAFTFIGFTTQEINVAGRTTIDLVMQTDAKQLSEVVVTALGIERSKNELSYAAQEVKGSEIVKNRQSNFVNALSGKIAGVDIKSSNTMGGSTNVIIRGYKSITGNNQALFVIDGIPVSNTNTNTATQRSGGGGPDYGNAAADINPDNIESINVLKGAAATALYGSRGMNGVVMITTKKGRKNSFNVVVNSGVTWGQIDKNTFAKYQKDYGAGYVLTFPGKLTLDDGERDYVHFQADASYGPKYDPNLLVYQWDALDPFHPNYRRATPWIFAKNGPDTYYETSVNSNQSVFVTGGTDKAIYKIGYTRSDEKGNLPNSSLDKDLFNFSATIDLTQRLKLEASANYSNMKGIGRYGTGYSGGNPNQAFRQWWATNVDIQQQREAYFRNRQNITWNWNGTTGAGPIYMDNPYWTRYENYSNDTRDNIMGYAAATYKITDWLDVIGRVGTNATFDFQEERIAVGSTAVANYTRFNRSFTENNYDLIFNIRKKLSEDLMLSGLLGGSMRRSKITGIRASTNGGLAVPRVYALRNSRNPMNPPAEDYERVGVDGLYAGADLTYREFLHIGGTYRVDKSTTLPQAHNEYGYFSVSGGFTFSKLMQDNTWLNNGKIMINYAEVGNDANALSVFTAYDKPTAIGNIPLFSLPGRLNNENLKSERLKSLEFGIQADFLEERVGFDVTYYHTRTINQILPVTVSTSTGYSSRFINAGEVENKGIEVSAFGIPVKTENFSWTVNANFTRNRNKVVELYSVGEQVVSNVPITTFQGGVSINAAVGHPYGIIRGTDFVYTNGQRTVNSLGYYQPTTSSSEIIGNPNPDWLAGVNNTFRYKNVSMSFLVDMRYGGDIFSLDMFYGDGSGLYPKTAALNDRGNPSRSLVSEGGGVILPGVNQDGSVNQTYAPNHNGSGATAYGYVANGGGGMPRAYYVYDGSYVKLRELALTYSIPSSLISRMNAFKAIDISVIGRNLWIIHKNLPYADPEESLSSGNANQGYQSGSYPAIRSLGFNVKFTF